MSYVELCCKSNHSFLRGASHPHELVNQAATLGLAGIGVTDINGVYGMAKAYRAARDLPQLRFVVGAQLTIEDLPPVTFLAAHRAGYGLLSRIITASHAAGDGPGQARLTLERLVALLESPARAGLIALPWLPHTYSCVEFYAILRDLFQDRLYLPLPRYLDGRDTERTILARTLSQKFSAPLVATNDVYYHVSSRRLLQDILTSIRINIPLAQAGSRLFSNGERYLKSPAQMAQLYADLPHALTTTLDIAARCSFSPCELRYRYPSEWLPAGESAQSFLEKLTWEGAERRYRATRARLPEAVAQQLKHELKLIAELCFADYFITVWDIVEYARRQNILYQGRGAAANSAVCYCLGITAIDPVRMNLLFERFISTERGEPPDIDVDFEHDRREEVLQYVYQKYGRDRAAMVAAINTYRTKSALRDVAKALGAASTLPSGNPDRGAPQSAVIAQLATELQGFPRHLSIHSGGFTLSADPLLETVPIQPARMEGRTIVQWDKNDLDTMGLLKIDLLSLGMLTALHKTFDLVNTVEAAAVASQGGVPLKALDLATIPPDDPATYAMIRKADTIGVFQIESRAQMSMLPRLLPQNYYDLVVQVAIVRPGPIRGDMVHPYLKRRRGLEPATVPDPRLEPILGRTLGVPLFQEQVMKIAVILAGFTPGEADELRRAIGAWRSTGSIDKMSNRFREGLIAGGLPLDFVDRIFRQIQGFAEYGFPESHAASFALLAYASSYLKRHHPAAFSCALLNSQPMGFYAAHTLVDDAKRHGVQILPVHPGHSDWDCTLTPDLSLQLGWRVVYGLPRAEVNNLLQVRRERPFSSLEDFLHRAPLRRHVLHQLALGDGFRCFGLDQRQSLWKILSHRGASEIVNPAGEKQLGLFSGLESTARHSPQFAPLSPFGAIQSDYQTYGLSARGHPMQALRLQNRKIPSMTSEQAKRHRAHTMIEAAGLVIARQRPQTAKGTVFATLEDETGCLDLIMHQEIYAVYGALFRSQPFLIIKGLIQRDGDSISVLVKKVRPVFLVDAAEEGAPSLRQQSHDWH